MARAYRGQRRLFPDEDDQKDGITFDKQGRMQYHPEFHPNHGIPFTTDDLIYLCKFYEIDGPRKISFALGKTECTVMVRVSRLKKDGLYEYYKNASDDQWLEVLMGK